MLIMNTNSVVVFNLDIKGQIFDATDNIGSCCKRCKRSRGKAARETEQGCEKSKLIQRTQTKIGLLGEKQAETDYESDTF